MALVQIMILWRKGTFSKNSTSLPTSGEVTVETFLPSTPRPQLQRIAGQSLPFEQNGCLFLPRVASPNSFGAFLKRDLCTIFWLSLATAESISILSNDCRSFFVHSSCILHLLGPYGFFSPSPAVAFGSNTRIFSSHFESKRSWNRLGHVIKNVAMY